MVKWLSQLIMMQKVAGMNLGSASRDSEKMYQPNSKWVRFSNQGRRDVGSTVPKIPWASSPYFPCGHWAMGNLYHHCILTFPTDMQKNFFTLKLPKNLKMVRHKLYNQTLRVQSA